MYYLPIISFLTNSLTWAWIIQRWSSSAVLSVRHSVAWFLAFRRPFSGVFAVRWPHSAFLSIRWTSPWFLSVLRPTPGIFSFIWPLPRLLPVLWPRSIVFSVWWPCPSVITAAGTSVPRVRSSFPVCRWSVSTPSAWRSRTPKIIFFVKIEKTLLP